MRRASFPLCYMAEILSGGFIPMMCAAMAGGLAVATATAAVWYGAELVLARSANWPLSARTVFAMVARDLMLPALWVAGWCGRRFVWRGNEMRARRAEFAAQ